MWRLILSVLLTALWTDYGYGQAKVQSSEIEHFVQTADGKPRLCGIEFTILFSDYVTSTAGRLAAARGSLSFAEEKGNIALFLKVGGMDFAAGPAQPPTKFAVANASLTAGETTYAASQLPCEENTMFCGIFWLPASGIIYSKLSRERTITLNFNRTKGSLDFQVPISRGTNAEDFKKSLPFEECMGTIISRAQAKYR